MEEKKIIEKFSDSEGGNPQIDKPAEGVPTPDIDLQTKLDLYTQLDVDMRMLSDEDTTKRVIDIYNWLHSINEKANTFDMTMMLQDVLAKIGRTDKSPLERIWDYMSIDQQIRALTSRRAGMEHGRD